MKLSNALFLTALAANGICILSFYSLTHLPDAQGADFIFILFVFPPIWVISFIVAIVMLVTPRFKALPDSSVLRFIAFFFCTPVPILAAFFGAVAIEEMGPQIFTNSQEFRNGVSYKSETWKGKEEAYFITEFYKADSVRLLSEGDGAYLKDSIWVYTNENIDTLKLEYYKNDQLVQTINRLSKKN